MAKQRAERSNAQPKMEVVEENDVGIDPHKKTLTASLRNRRAVLTKDAAAPPPIRPRCASQAVAEVAPSSFHSSAASKSPTAAQIFDASRSATRSTSARASPSRGMSSPSTTAASSSITPSIVHVFDQ